MAEVAAPPKEAVINAAKRQEGSLAKAVHEGTTVEVGRGKKRAEHTFSGDQFRQLLVDKQLEDIIVKRSRKLVPERVDKKATPTEKDKIALAGSADEIGRQIAFQAEVYKKVTYADLEKQLDPEELDRRRKAYQAQAEHEVARKIALSEKGVLAKAIGERYNAVAQTYTESLKKLPPVTPGERRGTSVLLETPKEALQRLLASDILSSEEKKVLRDTLSAPIDEVTTTSGDGTEIKTKRFAGNSFVEAYNTNLAKQWEEVEKPPEIKEPTLDTREDISACQARIATLLQTSLPDEQREALVQLSTDLAKFSWDVHYSSQLQSTADKKVALLQRVKTEHLFTPMDGEDRVTETSGRDYNTVAGVDRVIVLINQRLTLLTDPRARVPLENALYALEDRKQMLESYARLENPAERLQQEHQDLLSPEKTEKWEQRLQKLEVFPVVYDPQKPTLDTPAGTAHFLAQVQARIDASGGKGGTLSLIRLRGDLDYYAKKQIRLDPSDSQYGTEQKELQRVQEEILKQLERQGFLVSEASGEKTAVQEEKQQGNQPDNPPAEVSGQQEPRELGQADRARIENTLNWVAGQTRFPNAEAFARSVGARLGRFGATEAEIQTVLEHVPFDAVTQAGIVQPDLLQRVRASLQPQSPGRDAISSEPAVRLRPLSSVAHPEGAVPAAPVSSEGPGGETASDTQLATEVGRGGEQKSEGAAAAVEVLTPVVPETVDAAVSVVPTETGNETPEQKDAITRQLEHIDSQAVYRGMVAKVRGEVLFHGQQAQAANENVDGVADYHRFPPKTDEIYDPTFQIEALDYMIKDVMSNPQNAGPFKKLGTSHILAYYQDPKDPNLTRVCLMYPDVQRDGRNRRHNTDRVYMGFSSDTWGSLHSTIQANPDRMEEFYQMAAAGLDASIIREQSSEVVLVDLAKFIPRGSFKRDNMDGTMALHSRKSGLLQTLSYAHPLGNGRHGIRVAETPKPHLAAPMEALDESVAVDVTGEQPLVAKEPEVSAAVQEKWAEAQILVDTRDILGVDTLESFVEALDPLVEAAIQDGKKWEEVQERIDTTLREKAADAADKTIANAMAQALARQITNGGKDVGYDNARNIIQEYYQDPYLFSNQYNIMPKSPQDAVTVTFSAIDARMLTEMYANPQKVGLRELVGFLKDPQGFYASVELSITQNIQNRRYDTQQAEQQAAGLRKQLRTILMHGTNFLAEQAQHPDGMRILGKEFGFSAIGGWEQQGNTRFTNAQEVLKEWFGDEGEAAKASVDVLASLPQERKKYEEQASHNFKKAVVSVLDKTKREQVQIQDKGLAEVKILEFEQVVETKNDEIEQLTNKKITFLDRVKGMNEEKRAASLGKLEDEKRAAELALSQAHGTVRALAAVDTRRGTLVSSKVKRLQAFASRLAA